MATSRGDKTTKVTLRVETAADTYKNRILNYWNPSLQDATILTYATRLAGFQTHELQKVIRTDFASLNAE